MRRAYADVLIDKIDVLREYCSRKNGSERHAALVRGLQKIQLLPAKATLSEFLSLTRKIFDQLRWRQHWSEIDRLSRAWADRLSKSFSRNLYLRWLREVLGAPSLHRDDYGSHPYSRVHLLPTPKPKTRPGRTSYSPALTRKLGQRWMTSSVSSGIRKSTNSIGGTRF